MLVVLLWLLKKEVASMKRELLDNGNIWQKSDGRFDVVEVFGDEILYVPNAFQPYGQFYH